MCAGCACRRTDRANKESEMLVLRMTKMQHEQEDMMHIAQAMNAEVKQKGIELKLRKDELKRATSEVSAPLPSAGRSHDNVGPPALNPGDSESVPAIHTISCPLCIVIRRHVSRRWWLSTGRRLCRPKL